MKRTLRELLESIDSRELAEWRAFADIEPFGDDHRPMAQVAAILANVHRKRDAETVTADDFMPVKRAETPQSSQQVLAFFRALQQVDDGDDRES